MFCLLAAGMTVVKASRHRGLELKAVNTTS